MAVWWWVVDQYSGGGRHTGTSYRAGNARGLPLPAGLQALSPSPSGQEIERGALTTSPDDDELVLSHL